MNDLGQGQSCLLKSVLAVRTSCLHTVSCARCQTMKVKEQECLKTVSDGASCFSDDPHFCLCFVSLGSSCVRVGGVWCNYNRYKVSSVKEEKLKKKQKSLGRDAIMTQTLRGLLKLSGHQLLHL